MARKRSDRKARATARRPPGPGDSLPGRSGRAGATFDPVMDRIDSDWAPGMPDDPDTLPTTLYQLMDGRVHTLMTWPDESMARGEVPLQQLLDLLDGRQPIDGWYDLLGRYLGEHPPGSLLSE